MSEDIHFEQKLEKKTIQEPDVDATFELNISQVKPSYIPL